MDIHEVSSRQYGRLHNRLGQLPLDNAHGLRCRLAEKYYVYLDKLMQLKMALRDYDLVAEEAKTALEKKV